MSQVVIEFPALQGVDGRASTPRPAASATRSPAPSASTTGRCRRRRRCRRTLAGALLAVADKVDNIAGAWVAGEKPSGSRDPYGLRRAAMGIVRIALEYGLRFPLAGLLGVGRRPVRAAGRRRASTTSAARRIVAETAAFVRERLQVLLLDEGLPFPSVEAALARAGRRRAGAGGAGAHLRRARRPRLLRGRRRSPTTAAPRWRPRTRRAGSRAVDPALFTDDAERELAAACEAARGPLLDALAHLELESAIEAAAGLRPAVDRYFDAVLVMDPDDAVRANRLAQLAAVTGLLGRIGEFSRLPLQDAGR